MSPPRLTRRAIVAAAPLSALAAPALAATAGSGALAAEDLRVEWLTEPLGVDTLTPRFTWTLAASAPRRRAQRQAAFRVVVSASRADARAGRGEVWDSGRIEGALARARPAAPLNLLSHTAYFWTVQVWDAAGGASVSKPQRFVTGVIRPADWQARWIAAEPDRPVKVAQMYDAADRTRGEVMPIFRKGFRAQGKVRRAVLSICGLGQYELRLNGREVGDAVLNPGWTDYRRTVLYNTFDVTDLIAAGDNVLGVMLGNGMYNVEGVKGRYTKFVGSFGQPKLIAQLSLTHADGRQEVIGTDSSWLTRPGPVVFSHIYAGEDYDARRWPAGWDAPGPAGPGWSPALPARGPAGRLRAQGIPPVRVAQRYRPVKVSEPRPGVWVYDFGMNAASRPSMTVRGPAGATVTLKPAEVVDPATGLVDQRSVGARPDQPVAYHYTLRGGGEEQWAARFSYCGCRYIEVEGAAPAGRARPGQAEILRLESDFIHADVRLAGEFQSGDRLLVQIHDLIRQATLSNTVSVLTDCPHREKLGWLEQTHLNADTVFFTEDAVTLYEKLARDIADAQLPSGEIPEIAPEYVQFVDKDGSDTIFRDSPEWGAAVVLSPWAAYRTYGDAEVLRTGWPAMVGYTDYLLGKRKDGLVSYGLGDWLDIGPKKNVGVSQLTSLGLTSTAVLFQMLRDMGRIARVLGRPADAERYRRRAAEVRADFNRRLFDPRTNSYDTGSQTANAMPVALGLVPEGREGAVLDRLVADIAAHNDHVTAGDVGFHYVVQALMEHGRPDVLLRLLSRTDAPSYGAQLAGGATALTENWEPTDGGSQNHFMLGHAMSWLYRGLLGIDLDFSREAAPPLRIAPQILPAVGRASGRYRSVLGPIASAWSVTAGRATVDVEIPPGAVAQIALPAATSAVLLDGAPLRSNRGVLAVHAALTACTVTAGSGAYSFSFALG